MVIYDLLRRYNMKLSDLGKFTRKYRIDKNILLKDMAEELGISTAFLSAVETGRKAVPANFYDRLTKNYSFNNEEMKELKAAIDTTIKQATIPVPDNDLDRRLVGAFCRSFQDLDEQKKRDFLRILEGGNE